MKSIGFFNQLVHLNLRKIFFIVGLLCVGSVFAFNPTKFYISVNRMNPMGYASKDVSYSYSLSLSGDSVDIHLPYMGRAYQLPYGGGDGLNFKEPIKEFKNEVSKKGLHKISFKTQHQMNTYQFYLEIYPDNSNAYISVVPSNCESISYYGRLEEEKGNK